MMVVGVSVLVAPTAGATGSPTRNSFTDHRHIQDTGYCSFPVSADVVDTETDTLYYDAGGNLTRETFHYSTIGIHSANGKTIVENSHVAETATFALSGAQLTDRLRGTFQFRYPNGPLIQHDTGLVVADFVDGVPMVVFAPGDHHPLLTGDAARYCAALSAG
jgi:hypothetical protein